MRIPVLLPNLIALVLLSSCSEPPSPPPPPPPPIPTALLLPAHGAYTGAYIDFGDYEDDVTLEKIDSFERAAGKHQAIVAFSSYWGRDSFPTRAAGIVARHDSIPLIYWSPWGKPYEQDHPPDQYSLQAIVAGTWDGYIDSWADAAKDFKRPFFVAWGLEMNGTWFPWSGWYYGAGKTSSPGCFDGPELYKAAYRHVVDRVRARGVRNILWVFHTNNRNAPDESWNRMQNYYPGDSYVDWLGMSAYGTQFPDSPWITVTESFAAPYDELASLHPDKPIMLAEWGVGEFPASGDKARWITDAFSFMQERMPRLKASVFWNERWENPSGAYSNLRASSSPQSLRAYRAGVASSYWIAAPLYR